MDVRYWDAECGIGYLPAHRGEEIAGSVIDGVHSEAVAGQLAEQGVFVSHGDYYASVCVERLGYAEHGLVRAGAACYTSAPEVDRLIEGVRQLAR